MSGSRDPRLIAQQVADDVEERIYDGLDVGQPGTDRRREWLDQERWVAERKKRYEARKDQQRTLLVGFGGSMVAGAGGLVVSWLTGVWPWLSSFFTAKP